jgi:hypothetical protein
VCPASASARTVSAPNPLDAPVTTMFFAMIVLLLR